jgi:threonine aldolase
VAAIGNACRAHGLKLHMDGARFANAVAHVGCHPADVSWRAGVDALSFGFTKNGAMLAEALVFFGGSGGAGVRELRKRGGHLLSKGRFVAAQILAMLADDLWLTNARAANAGAAALAEACGERLLHPVEANELFVRLTADEAARLRDAGYDFYDWGEGAARLVVSWDQDAAALAPLAAAIAAL